MVTRNWLILALAAMTLPCNGGTPPATTPIEDDGTVHVPAFDMPFSGYASPEMRRAFVEQSRTVSEIYARMAREKISSQRAFDEGFYPALIAAQLKRYPVDTEVTHIAGVYAEIFTARAGVSKRNQHRVLINLHGGAWRTGARTGGRVESIPIAGVGGFKVISLDYRQSPENRYPAASEDLAAVYRALLKEYPARNIGIYGCSAGANTITQALAAFGKQGLPTPGAVGLFGSGAQYGDGEANYLTAALHGGRPMPRGPNPVYNNLDYFKGADLTDPMVVPLLSPEIMAKFPPTLLLNGLRDGFWSDTLATHNMLVRVGVEADLHLWEGAAHCFQYDPEIPESRDAYDIIVKFFDRHLGK